VQGLGLQTFGDLEHEPSNVVAVHIPDGVDGDAVRAGLLEHFDIGVRRARRLLLERPGSGARLPRPGARSGTARAAHWMERAGLSSWQDVAGNQWGRQEGREPGCRLSCSVPT
jgi:hypothetical protein